MEDWIYLVKTEFFSLKFYFTIFYLFFLLVSIQKVHEHSASYTLLNFWGLNSKRNCYVCKFLLSFYANFSTLQIFTYNPKYKLYSYISWRYRFTSDYLCVPCKADDGWHHVLNNLNGRSLCPVYYPLVLASHTALVWDLGASILLIGSRNLRFNWYDSASIHQKKISK